MGEDRTLRGETKFVQLIILMVLFHCGIIFKFLIDRLDGLSLGRKRAGNDDDKVDSTSSIENWLQSHLPEDYVFRQQTKPGQKRVSNAFTFTGTCYFYFWCWMLRCAGRTLKNDAPKRECGMLVLSLVTRTGTE